MKNISKNIRKKALIIAVILTAGIVAGGFLANNSGNGEITQDEPIMGYEAYDGIEVVEGEIFRNSIRPMEDDAFNMGEASYRWKEGWFVDLNAVNLFGTSISFTHVSVSDDLDVGTQIQTASLSADNLYSDNFWTDYASISSDLEVVSGSFGDLWATTFTDLTLTITGGDITSGDLFSFGYASVSSEMQIPSASFTTHLYAGTFTDDTLTITGGNISAGVLFDMDNASVSEDLEVVGIVKGGSFEDGILTIDGSGNITSGVWLDFDNVSASEDLEVVGITKSGTFQDGTLAINSGNITSGELIQFNQASISEAVIGSASFTTLNFGGGTLTADGLSVIHASISDDLTELDYLEVIRASISDSLKIEDTTRTANLVVDTAISFPSGTIAVSDLALAEGYLIVGDASSYGSAYGLGASNSYLLSNGTTAIWNDLIVDISDDTNLMAGTGITLTGDSLSVDLGTSIDISDETNLAAVEPLFIIGDSVDIELASTAGDGYLSSTDWDTFYGKADAFTVITPLELGDSSISFNYGAEFTKSGDDLILSTGGIAESKIDIATGPADNYILFYNSAEGKLDYITATSSWDTDTTYSAGGTLLDLTTGTFSINEGTLTNGKGCKFVTATGLVCDQDYLTTVAVSTPLEYGNASMSFNYGSEFTLSGDDLILSTAGIAESKLDIESAPTDNYVLFWDNDLGKFDYVSTTSWDTDTDTTYTAKSPLSLVGAEFDCDEASTSGDGCLTSGDHDLFTAKFDAVSSESIHIAADKTLTVDGTASVSSTLYLGGKLTLVDALDVAYGGTNLTTIGASEIPYGSSAGVFGVIASPTEDYVLAEVNGVPGWAAAGAGDVISVGDCADGACLDGSADGGQYIRLYDQDSHYLELNVGDLSGHITLNFPTTAIVASDLLYGSAANTLGRIASGTEDKILTMYDGVPTWRAGGGGDLKADGTIDLTGDWTISTNDITLTIGSLTADSLLGTYASLSSNFEVSGTASISVLTLDTKLDTSDYINITGGTGITMNGDAIDLDNDFGADISEDELANTDFGDFTCDGGDQGCTLDDTFLTTIGDLGLDAFADVATDSVTNLEILGYDNTADDWKNMTPTELGLIYDGGTLTNGYLCVADGTNGAIDCNVANNSSNWNDAYSWEDHGGLYASQSFRAELDALSGLVKGDGAGNYSAVTDNSSNWNLAYDWGDHAGEYASQSFRAELDALSGLLIGDGAGNYSATTDNSSDWDTAHDERGSQIAGDNLTWDTNHLDVDDPFSVTTFTTTHASISDDLTIESELVIASDSFEMPMASTQFDIPALQLKKRMGEAGTIIGIHCHVIDGTSRTAELIICDGATCGDGGSVDSVLTCSTVGVDDDGTLASASFGAGDYIMASTSDGASSGSPNSLWISVDVNY